MKKSVTVLAAFVGGAAAAHLAAARQPEAPARVFQSPGGTTLRVLLDQTDLKGTEVEVAELTFRPNSDSGDHQHGVVETFHVLEGELEHVVDGPEREAVPGHGGNRAAAGPGSPQDGRGRCEDARHLGARWRDCARHLAMARAAGRQIECSCGVSRSETWC